MKDKIDILAKHLRDIECVHKSTHSPEKMAVRIINKLDSLYKAEQRDRYDRAIDWWNRNVIGTIKNTPKVIYGPNPKLIDRALRIASGIDKQKEER